MSAIDLVRDGVDPVTFAAEGDRAVWSLLLSTAMSWRLRRSTYIDWTTTLDHPQSNLGRQARTTRKGRMRGAMAYDRLIRKAWARAGHHLDHGTPLRTADDFRADAKIIGEALDLGVDIDGLADADRRMLRYVVALAEQHGTGSPCVPCRPAAEALDVTPMTASRTLRRLVAAGWLDLAEQGAPRGPAAVGPPRASRYSVEADRLACLLLTYDGDIVSNTPRIVSNTDRDNPTTTEEIAVPDPITITATPPARSPPPSLRRPPRSSPAPSPRPGCPCRSRLHRSTPAAMTLT